MASCALVGAGAGRLGREGHCPRHFSLPRNFAIPHHSLVLKPIWTGSLLIALAIQFPELPVLLAQPDHYGDFCANHPPPLPGPPRLQAATHPRRFPPPPPLLASSAGSRQGSGHRAREAAAAAPVARGPGRARRGVGRGLG